MRLVEQLACPVWQESFGARAGFPQDHRLFAGHLPAARARLRGVLDPHDAILVVGAPVFRQYPYDDGPLAPPGARVALVTDDGAEAHRSPTELTLLADPAATCAALAEQRWRRGSRKLPTPRRAAAPAPLQATPEWIAAAFRARTLDAGRAATARRVVAWRRRRRAARSCTRACPRASRWAS